MTTNRSIQADGNEIIYWTKENGECGQITIKYDGGGKFIVDSEYLSLDSLYNIIKHVKTAPLDEGPFLDIPE